MNENRMKPVYRRSEIPTSMTAAEEERFWQAHYMSEPLLNEMFAIGQVNTVHTAEDE
ncbi:hypothetical protein [Ectobacillus ponti]|uniref:Uncharacterized protein n=1 Tax=Ectobacillus ponti TaxID=2961894 RepID=A0AA42BQJ9_9BACI|nr:hypothetical protein [Ectobacillus ponti]MCP8970375.1 hypothetical protein [Ectobacillus ponti]